MARETNDTRRATTGTLFIALVFNIGCGAEPGDDTGKNLGGAGSVSASGGGTAGATAGAGGSAGAAPACSDYASAAPAHEFGPGQNIGQNLFPGPVLGPPKGGGCCQGSLDVVSLGNGGSITLTFGDTSIVDGEGPDFIVFENAFYAGGDTEKPFAELGTVAVSEDGATWTEFPCTAVAAPYGSCAGWHPVFANPDDNSLDPLDPLVAGGDAFDLLDIGVTSARFVRVTDRADLEGAAGVFDLDAVGIVNAECP
jgi:hypothetical protein